jgi:two-component system cell cycle sensor histidine kinase/response regulator CckA
VKRAGGSVGVTSAPGQGSRFDVWLPRSLAPVEPMPAPLRATRPGPGAETVLVVEDEDAVRSRISRSLLSHGYQVVEARNGHGALDVLRRTQGRIGAVLSDVRMPQMGGLDLIRALRADHPLLPVLLMSGYPQASERLEGLANVELLRKPFTPSELVAAIERLLRPETPAAPTD